MAGRYYLYLLIGFICGSLMACQSAAESPEALTIPATINVPVFQNTADLSCIASTEELKDKMGLGIMRLAIRKDSTLLVFPTPACNRKEGISITLKDRPGWVLVSPIHLSPFEHSTNFHHFSFLWKTTDTAYAAYGVQLDTADQLYWVSKKTASTHYFLSWADYLLQQRIRFLQKDAFRASPTSVSDTLPYQSGVFLVQAIQGPWMRVAYLAPDNQQNDDPLPSSGWRKWFCNGTYQIAILDDTFMEDYLLNGK